MDYEITYGIKMPRSRWRDIGGERFGKLTAVHPTGNKKHGQHTWLCICDCGTTKEIPIGSLNAKKGGTRSCGCLITEHNSTYTTHGMSRTKMYERWRSMLRRCNDVRSKAYPFYGARGIKVCVEWHSFENFYKDMGSPPHKNAEIDRIDNDGGYSPDNCQWLTKTENLKKIAADRKLRKTA